jgi:hypothetical protein
MNNIPRYNQTGLFNILKQDDNGALCYFFNIEKELHNIFESKKLLLDKFLIEKLKSKKYFVLMSVSFVINIGFIIHYL